MIWCSSAAQPPGLPGLREGARALVVCGGSGWGELWGPVLEEAVPRCGTTSVPGLGGVAAEANWVIFPQGRINKMFTGSPGCEALH